MEVSAEFESDILDIIKARRSRRAYLNTPIEPRKIRSLFEAARWAPSSVNEQPWAYIYATSDQRELWNKIFNALNEGNKLWAKEAPMLVVSLARKAFSKNERPNASAKYDVGAANAFLSLQATALGLNVHQMGGFDQNVLRESLNVPEFFDVGVVMAIGYAGDPEKLPLSLKERELSPRLRHRQNEFVMNHTF
ncbi:MAG TPA: nitroreductase family protein [Cyclobacteriaceae bacterium]|nr:nitroreductase family protein [Cyclobacteriaceae bacterium]